MAEMICDISGVASIDVWAGSPDSVDATPLMPQNTLSQRDAGGHRRSRRWFRAHGLAARYVRNRLALLRFRRAPSHISTF